jgi:hypothetical protein
MTYVFWCMCVFALLSVAMWSILYQYVPDSETEESESTPSGRHRLSVTVMVCGCICFLLLLVVTCSHAWQMVSYAAKYRHTTIAPVANTPHHHRNASDAAMGAMRALIMDRTGSRMTNGGVGFIVVLVCLKLVVLMFMFIGLFLSPMITFYNQGILPMLAGGQKSSAHTTFARSCDNVFRVVLGVFMGFLCALLFLYIYGMQPSLHRFMMELATLGCVIGAMAAVQSALSVGDPVISAEVEYAI